MSQNRITYETNPETAIKYSYQSLRTFLQGINSAKTVYRFSLFIILIFCEFSVTGLYGRKSFKGMQSSKFVTSL